MQGIKKRVFQIQWIIKLPRLDVQR